MRNTGNLLWLALVLVMVAAAAIPCQAAVAVGQKAPDFTLANLNGRGNLTLSSTLGKATVLVFWQTRCSHCLNEMPNLQRLYAELKDKGLVIMGVDFDRDSGDASAYIKKNSITFPVAYGGTRTGYGLLDTYGVRGVPTLFLLDDKGIVKFIHIGEVDTATLKSDLSTLGVK